MSKKNRFGSWMVILDFRHYLSSGPIANALTLTHSILDVNLNFRECDGPLQMINLGDLSVSLSNDAGAGKGVHATFDVDANVEGSTIFDCFDLHWLQYITADDCPATVARVAAGTVGLPFPTIDTPPNGWDYIYNDNDAPADGIQADERVPETPPAHARRRCQRHRPVVSHRGGRAMAAGSGNQAGGLGTFTRGETYGLIDVPGLFAPPGTCTAFTTFLVAVPTHTCDGPDCLALDEMLVLAGFDWVWSSDNMKLALGNTAEGAVNIETGAGQHGLFGLGSVRWRHHLLS